MKTGIVFLIHWAIVFVILLIYAFLTHNTMNIRSVSGVILTSAIISGILLLFTKTTNVHENFLFQVSAAKEKCMNEQVQGGPNRSPGCCSKDTTGVGSLSPFPMTPGNWPYRADEFLPNQKASVPPIDSCACDTKAYDSNAGNIPASIQYPPKYQTLKETNAVDSADASTQENYSSCCGGSRPVVKGVDNVDTKSNKEQFEKINAIKNAHVVMYVSDNCSHCNKTKAMFNDLGIDKYIVVNNAKDHLDYLKSENIKYIPFLKSDTGKHEGAVKDIDDLIAKLNILVKSDNQHESQSQEDNQHESQSQEDNQHESQSQEDNQHESQEYYKDKVPSSDENAKKSVKETYKSSEQSETNLIANEKQYQIINDRGMLNESTVDHFVETYVPNYKDNNYLTKMGTYSGYYSYENYLPDSKKYGSMAGQLIPPGPCGRANEGTR
jgi:glutaredoxin